MSEIQRKIDEFFDENLSGTYESEKPLIRSLVLSLYATHLEQIDRRKVGLVWERNTDLRNEYIDSNPPEAVWEVAMTLATLPTHENPQYEMYRGWLRGNGLSLIFDDGLRKTLLEYIETEESNKLVPALLSFLNANVTGFTKRDLSNHPETYSMLLAFLICSHLQTNSNPDSRSNTLIASAQNRLADPEVIRVMAYFGDIKDTQPLYQQFKVWMDAVVSQQIIHSK